MLAASNSAAAEAKDVKAALKIKLVRPNIAWPETEPAENVRTWQIVNSTNRESVAWNMISLVEPTGECGQERCDEARDPKRYDGSATSNLSLRGKRNSRQKSSKLLRSLFVLIALRETTTSSRFPEPPPVTCHNACPDRWPHGAARMLRVPLPTRSSPSYRRSTIRQNGCTFFGWVPE
jgi:hypothetical protein